MNGDTVIKVLAAIAQTFAYFAVGILALRLRYLDKDDVNRVGTFTMDVLFPFCSFASVAGGMRNATAAELWLPPVLGFGIIAFNALCGLGLQYGLRDRSVPRLKAFRQMAAVNNYLFLPIIIVAGLYGDAGVGCLMLFSVGSAVGFWSVGLAVMSSDFGWREMGKKLLSPNLSVIVLALALVLLKVPVPQFVINISSGIGGIATPLMLVLTGASLAGTGAQLFREPRDAAWGVVSRLVIIPFLTAGLLWLLPLRPLVFSVAFIIALMPSSCASVLLVHQYGGDPDYSGQQLLLTTVLCPVTVIGFIYLFTLI